MYDKRFWQCLWRQPLKTDIYDLNVFDSVYEGDTAPPLIKKSEWAQV